MAKSLNSQNEEAELTMCDVLEEEQELEDDANAVLGGSDDTNCSYDKGYVPRQALYACITCSADNEPSGVCLACSYKCHDGHEIVELYTKRNFRCDCGNSKFLGKPCTLKPDKEAVNQLNKYNQNFKGLYCSCSRPYPDLEDNTPDEMIQCVMCEDWYHGRHIGDVVPEHYFEMICSKCMESHNFLYAYLNKFICVNVTGDSHEEKCSGAVKHTDKVQVSSTQAEVSEQHVKVENSIEIPSNHPEKPDASAEGNTAFIKEELSISDVETVKQKHPYSKLSIEPEVSSFQSENPSGPTEEINASVKEDSIKFDVETIVKHKCSDSELDVKPGVSCNQFENPGGLTKEKITDSEEENCVKSNAESVKEQEKSDCLFSKLFIKPDGITHGPAFWPENWRKELCRCASCMDMYRKYECEYILSIDDTILAYEERGKSTSESQYDKGMNALSRLDRVKQMEAIRAYTSMKGQLKEYLKDFANSKKTVCESDIKEFFDRISKRQKLNNGVPHFCR